MTTISSHIVEDSINPKGIRLTTLLLRYPRWIHDEVLTHRVFSRNSSSSRAIPVQRLIDDIERDPAEPIHWGANQKGMQARKELSDSNINTMKALWREDREHSILMARAMADVGGHKQIVNRIIQNHGHINVVVTATDWRNFLFLRDHPDAQPEIAQLATRMRIALLDSTPRFIDFGKWHLPFITNEERSWIEMDKLILISTARCARTSYKTHEGVRPRLEDDLRLAHDLVSAGESDPKHASPAEHQATPADDVDFHRNFRGWTMYRTMITNDTVWG